MQIRICFCTNFHLPKNSEKNHVALHHERWPESTFSEAIWKTCGILGHPNNGMSDSFENIYIQIWRTTRTRLRCVDGEKKTRKEKRDERFEKYCKPIFKNIRKSHTEFQKVLYHHWPKHRSVFYWKSDIVPA